MSDVDVVWLASPWPLVRYAKDGTPPVRPEAALLALADVVLSVDQVQQYMDSDEHSWHIGSEWAAHGSNRPRGGRAAPAIYR